MNTTVKNLLVLLSAWFFLSALTGAWAAESQSAAQALVTGQASLDLRLRFESVSQANAVADVAIIAARPKAAPVICRLLAVKSPAMVKTLRRSPCRRR